MGYRDLSERFHRPICDFLDHNPSRYKLVGQSRSTFKTSLGTISKNARDALKYPNRRFAIINEVEDRACAWLTTIRGVYESNPIIRTLFSDIVPANPRESPHWSSHAVTLNRDVEVPEPTLAAYGITSSLVGWHHTDWTIDDPVSKKHVEEPSSMEKAIRRVSEITALMVDPSKDRQTFIGTPKAKHDVLNHFRTAYGKDLATYWIPAVQQDQLTFPERITWEVLDEARRTLGEMDYSSEYLLRVRDQATEDFRANDLRTYRFGTDEGIIVPLNADGTDAGVLFTNDLDITMTVDPAMSEKEQDDENAIVVCGTTGDGKVFVLETWHQRTTPDKVVEAIFDLYLKWGPRILGIESVAYQKSLKYWLQSYGERRGVFIPVRDMPRRTKKVIVIRGLQPIAATGRLYLRHEMHTLREQMLDFPDPSVHDDVLDALAMHLSLFQGVLEAKTVERQGQELQQILKRISGYNLAPGRSLLTDDPDDDDERFDFPELMVTR